MMTYVIETLVNSVYFRGMKNLNEKSPNELRKVQFVQSTSNDMKKLAPSSDALYMHSLRATHTAGFKWAECLRNVVLSDPSVRGYIMKNDICSKVVAQSSYICSCDISANV